MFLRKKNFLILSLIIFVPTYSYSSAWVKDKGQGQAFYNIYLSQFNKFYKTNGNREKQPTFYKTEFKPYVEYGATNEITLGFSPSIQTVKIADLKNSDTNNALQYTEFYFKNNLYYKNGYAASLEQVLEIPGFYSERETPSFGKKDYFLRSKIYLGKGFSISDMLSGFVQFGGGIRNRFYDYFGGESGSALKADFTFGMTFGSYQYFFRYDSTRSLTGYKSRFNLLDRYGYDQDKIEISSLKNYGDYALEIGYSFDVTGKNTGSGDTVKFSIWQKF
jgi:hypothetical protein